MSQIYTAILRKKEQVSQNAFSFTFELPKDAKADFSFTPGQYLTIERVIKGEKIRRAYSICSRMDNEHISVGVKRVEGGRMSNALIDTLELGHEVHLLRPEGRFIIEPNPENRQQYFFIAAGSGITPILSMIRSVLEFEPKSNCVLLYGNRKKENIMFHKDLLALEEQHQGQLKVLFTLTKPDNAGLKSLFKRKKDSWEGSKGRIDQSQLEEIIQKESMKEIQSSFYVCGPGNMIEEVKRSLMELGTDDSIIHTEYFSNPDQDQKDSGAQDTVSMESKLKVHLEGQDIETTMNSKMTVLDHLIDKGFDPPHSCTSGACSTCMAKIVSGTVEMEACFALDDKEVKAGYILTCQSHPTSPELEITFDV